MDPPKDSNEWWEGFRSLTDSSLAGLGLDDLLSELLNRVRDILDADTAAILILDWESQMLVARAASGLEEEIYQNVQVPIGHGFAGRIASTQRPVMLDSVNPGTVANPILWEKGIRSMLGVPLLSGDSLLGVLHVGRLSERPFTLEDADLLGVVAERVALAYQTAMLATERAASEILERSLVPSPIPRVPSFEFAARYVTPAQERGVGGDWYDVFQLPSGDVWMSVGDVAGHGLRSAVVMSRLRTMIRVHAFGGAGPDEVLRSTDGVFQYFDPDELATVVCVVVSPSSDELLVCSAGHPPPILAPPDGQAQPLELEPGPPLGVAQDLKRPTTDFHFPPGAMLVLYTDGLIERRGEKTTDRLKQVCRIVTTESPDVVCRRVMFRLVGNTPPRDDITLLAAKRLAPDST
jgi:sigma-B regulation protein RsbU (phosphoserine phosphatase)